MKSYANASERAKKWKNIKFEERSERLLIARERFLEERYHSPVQPCGTNAAFQRHLYHGETPCDPCRQARNSYQNRRRRR